MTVERLDHMTIRCVDLERTRTFYCDALGLKVGPRPDIPIPGYWLYCNDIPLVHIVGGEIAEGAPKKPETRGFDHIAFRVSDPTPIIAALKARDIPFQDRSLPDFNLRQLVVHDPDGVMVELNFMTG